MSRTVLIVEDDLPIRENLRAILEMDDYSVLEAAHGKQALEILKEAGANGTLPFVILLDLNMPVMPGREFLSVLSSLEETLSKIPVIVMTAVPEAKDLGTEGFLRKPVDLDTLLNKISRIGAHSH